MKRILLTVGCLTALVAQAQDGYRPGGYVRRDAEFMRPRRYYGPEADRPFGRRIFRPRIIPRWRLDDELEWEIARLERMLDRGTPAPSGRFGEVTARFGPRWSPYFWSQIRVPRGQDGEVPAPGTPEAEALLAELAEGVLRRHDSAIAERLLALYELRALRRRADSGIPPDTTEAQLPQYDRPPAPRPPEDYPLAPAGSVVKVATFKDPTGHLLPKDGGPHVLSTLTFTPDSRHNIVLMMSLRATLQRIGDSPSTASFGLETVLPEDETGLHETVAGPSIHLTEDDPTVIRKGSSSLCSGDEATGSGGLHDQPRYTFRFTTPDGAWGGDVRVSHIVLKVYYLTGGFAEAGTIIEE